jgi:hypothetical protein
LGLAIVSLLVLAIIGGPCGLDPRPASSARRRPATRTSRGEGAKKTETRRAASARDQAVGLVLLGMGAAGAPFSWTLRRYQAFFNDQQFVNNAVPVAFLAVYAGDYRLLLGSRMSRSGRRLYGDRPCGRSGDSAVALERAGERYPRPAPLLVISRIANDSPSAGVCCSSLQDMIIVFVDLLGALRPLQANPS